MTISLSEFYPKSITVLPHFLETTDSLCASMVLDLFTQVLILANVDFDELHHPPYIQASLKEIENGLFNNFSGKTVKKAIDLLNDLDLIRTYNTVSETGGAGRNTYMCNFDCSWIDNYKKLKKSK